MPVQKINYAHDFLYDGVRMVIFHAKKGQGLPMHGHNFHHGFVCNSGSCLVTLEDGRSKTVNKYSQPINLLNNQKHEIEALEDETVFVNIFADNKY
jgi:quercetin dioxygenase-like cupin family protein